MNKQALLLWIVIFGSLFLISGCVAASPADQGSIAWKFRSDLKNSGIYDDGGTRPGSIERWNYTTGSYIESSPAVVNGIVYIGSGDHKVYALHADTGIQIWNFTTGGYVDSSPAIANGIAYVGSYDNKIYALNAETGSQIWNFTTGGWVSSSPAIANGIVYIGSYDNKVYALDGDTGIQIWNYTTGNYVDSSPAVENGTVYFASSDDKVYALSAENGTPLWIFATGGWAFSSPALENDILYIGSDDYKVYALNAATGSQIWSFTTGGWVDSSPAIANGVVYIASNDYHVYALDAMTGSHIWNFSIGDDSGWVYSSPAVANDIVYIGSSDHNVYALTADTGDELWNFTTGDKVRSSPAVANGTVYIGSTDQKIYAIGLTAPVPPMSVTGLHNSTYQPTSITWNWTDPPSTDFDHVMVYLDSEFQSNISKGTRSYTAQSLKPDTGYTLATRTVGSTGLCNLTWVNCTALTAPGEGITIVLDHGWNLFSTPILLDPNSSQLKQIFSPGSLDHIDTILGYDGIYWFTPDTSYSLHPLDALYIKVNGSAKAVITPSPAISPPPSRNLSVGISLVGPAPEYTHQEFPHMPLDQAFISINQTSQGQTGYIMVLSPALNQPGWGYARGGLNRDIIPFKGYWIVMQNPDILYGFSTTPINQGGNAG
jgi:outer membrane protein assembly factor BamB